MIQLYKITKHILFLLNVFYIIISEFVLYCIYKDYNATIYWLSHRLASINILYVKLFQAIALNNCMIDDEVNNQLLRFTDNAPWNYMDIRVEELLKICSEFNVELYNNNKPTNAGMISLVFYGYKKEDGKNIVIKMKRNHIDEKLNDAIENLQIFLYILSFIPQIQKYQIDEIVNKNIRIIQQQTNFFEEIENMVHIRKNCARLKYIQIPEVYEEVTKKNSNFIMMEYIDGKKINEIKEVDYYGFAKSIFKFGLVTSIIHGITHGDLHSGNILFIKDENTHGNDTKNKYKIGVLDFGIVYKFNSNYKNLLFDSLTHIFNNTSRESASQLLKIGYIDPPNFWEKISEAQLEEMINIISNIISEATNKSNQIQIYKLIFNLKEYLSKPEIAKIGIKPSDDFIKLQLVLAMAQGVTYKLCKNSFMTLADEVINELFQTNILM